MTKNCALRRVLLHTFDVRDLLLIRAAMRGGTAQGIPTNKKREVKHEKENHNEKTFVRAVLTLRK